MGFYSTVLPPCLPASLSPSLPPTADSYSPDNFQALLALDPERIPTVVPKPRRAHPIVLLDDSCHEVVLVIRVFLCTWKHTQFLLAGEHCHSLSTLSSSSGTCRARMFSPAPTGSFRAVTLPLTPPCTAHPAGLPPPRPRGFAGSAPLLLLGRSEHGAGKFHVQSWIFVGLIQRSWQSLTGTDFGRQGRIVKL